MESLKVAWIEDQIDKVAEYELALNGVGIETVIYENYEQAKSFFERGGGETVDGVIFDILIPYGGENGKECESGIGLELMKFLIPEYIEPEMCFVLTMLDVTDIKENINRVLIVNIPDKNIFTKTDNSKNFAKYIKKTLKKLKKINV